MARAATETQKAGLTGLEFGLAIPGTVGGAVWANAGAHDADVAGGPRLGAGPRRRRERSRSCRAAELGLAYRDSRFKHAAATGRAELILEATFRLEPADPEVIKGASTTSAAGARRTSRSGCPRPAASSATRTATRPAG